MNDLEKSLGKALTTKELAEYLGVTEKIIRENYRQFGGIKIGRHNSHRLWQRCFLMLLLKSSSLEISPCQCDTEMH